MSWLDIFRRAVPKVGELSEDKRIRYKKKQHTYVCDCVIYYEGNALRRARFSISAYSRSHAEKQMREKLTIQVARTIKKK